MRVTEERLTERRPGEQDGASDNQGWVSSPEYQRGVCGSEGGCNEDLGLYPKNHGKKLKSFFFSSLKGVTRSRFTC